MKRRWTGYCIYQTDDSVELVEYDCYTDHDGKRFAVTDGKKFQIDGPFGLLVQPQPSFKKALRYFLKACRRGIAYHRQG